MNGFEFDHNKSQSNMDKHGIDFKTAQKLWLDPFIVEISTKIIDEPRFLVIGRISEKYWSSIITYRNNNIRIISVRRSRTEEVQIDES